MKLLEFAPPLSGGVYSLAWFDVARCTPSAIIAAVPRKTAAEMRSRNCFAVGAVWLRVRLAAVRALWTSFRAVKVVAP